jgi:hypothetical protein
MKNLVVTLDIKYPKEITDLTFPYMQEYAKNIDADFKIITERKYPDLPIPMEKFQLYELCEYYDWTIFLDADDLINPKSVNLTKIIEKHTVIVSEYLNYKVNPQYNIDVKIHCPFHFLCFHKMLKNVVKPHKSPKKFLKYINLKKELIENNKDISWHLDELILSKNIVKHKIPTISLKDDIIKLYNLNILAFDGNYLNLQQKIDFIQKNIERLKTMSIIQGEYV